MRGPKLTGRVLTHETERRHIGSHDLLTTHPAESVGWSGCIRSSCRKKVFFKLQNSGFNRGETRRGSSFFISRAARFPSRWACIEAALCDATSERRSSTPQPANGHARVAKPHDASCAAALLRESRAGQPASSATPLSPSSFTPKRQHTRSASTVALTIQLRGSAAATTPREASLRHVGHLRCATRAVGFTRAVETHARQKVCPHAGSDTGAASTSRYTVQ